jgi:hypothetical protein
MPGAHDDRRDSPRVPFTFQVREAALGGSFETKPGNLAIGGIYYSGLHPPQGSVVDIRFLLPGHAQEIMARGEVVRVSRDPDRFGAHIRFTEIPLESELALARFFHALPAEAT